MGFISDQLLKLLSELPANSVLRDRIEFLRDRIEDLEKRVKSLDDENAELKKENSDFKQRLEVLATQDNFVDHLGAVFKRRPRGGFHRAVYCPNCATSTAQFEGTGTFVCSICDWESQFLAKDLDSVLKEVEEEHG